MKTIQELYNEVMGNQELKEKLIEAAKAGKQEDFLKEMGCEATPEEVAAFLKAKAEEDAPLSVDELENSAGGKCNAETHDEGILSFFTAGVGCAVYAIVSAASDNRQVGQRNDRSGRLCS